MARPYIGAVEAISGNPVKNGTIVVATTGFRYNSAGANSEVYKELDSYVTNEPTIATLEYKYGYRFYNGIFVDGVDGGGP